jgi:formate dehydrogenase maturation protein FdhE
MSVTLEQERKYVEMKGTRCPYCGSMDISSDRTEAAGNEAFSVVTCNCCGKKWMDVYKLIGILNARD